MLSYCHSIFNFSITSFIYWSSSRKECFIRFAFNYPVLPLFISDNLREITLIYYHALRFISLLHLLPYNIWYTKCFLSTSKSFCDSGWYILLLCFYHLFTYYVSKLLHACLILMTSSFPRVTGYIFSKAHRAGYQE